jgi:hypothetical protein
MLAVVVDAPVLGEDLGLGQARERFEVQQLVTHTSVEGFRERVLPRRARLDVAGRDRRALTPVAQRVGGQLGPLSQRTFSGQPRSATSASNETTVCSAVMLRATLITCASLVNSSTMFSNLSILPSLVWSYW